MTGNEKFLVSTKDPLSESPITLWEYRKALQLVVGTALTGVEGKNKYSDIQSSP